MDNIFIIKLDIVCIPEYVPRLLVFIMNGTACTQTLKRQLKSFLRLSVCCITGTPGRLYTLHT